MNIRINRVIVRHTNTHTHTIRKNRPKGINSFCAFNQSISNWIQEGPQALSITVLLTWGLKDDTETTAGGTLRGPGGECLCNGIIMADM